MKIMTGKAGTPHVTAQQFRQFVEGTVGQESYILTSGDLLEPELVSNNSLKIRSGIMSHHGNLSTVDLGTYDTVTIRNGSQGMKRIDLVVNRYTKNKETGIEKNEWIVIMGNPTSGSPSVPTYTQGNLQEGDLVDDCPVFEVHLSGINVTDVKKMLKVVPSIPTINKDLSELQAKLAGYEYSRDEQIIGRWINGQNLYRKFVEIGNFSSGQSTIVPHKIQGLSRLVQISGMALKTTDGTMMSIPFAATDPAYSISVTINTQNIEIKHGTGRSSYWAMVILEYIKNN